MTGPYRKVVATVLFHSISSIGVTLIAKASLRNFDAPLLMLTLQTLIQIVLIGSIGHFWGVVSFRRKLEQWVAIAPLSLARLVGIIAKTFCLSAVDATFYQIARGLLLPFTFVLSLLLLPTANSTNGKVLVGMMVILVGFTWGFFSDFSSLHTDTRGLVLGVGSSLTTAIETVVVKSYTLKDQESMWQLVFMSSLLHLGAYIPILLLNGDISRLMAENMEVSSVFLKSILCSGVAQTFLVVATFLQISVTTPTTHTIVTAARGVLQALLASILFHEALTQSRMWSMLLIVSGSAMYARGKDDLQKSRSTSYTAVPTDAPSSKSDMEELRVENISNFNSNTLPLSGQAIL